MFDKGNEPKTDAKKLIGSLVLLLKIGAAIGLYRYIQLHPDLNRTVFVWACISSVMAVTAALYLSLVRKTSRKASTSHWVYLLLAFIVYLLGQALVSWADTYPPESILSNALLDGVLVALYSSTYGLLAFSFSLQILQLTLPSHAAEKMTRRKKRK